MNTEENNNHLPEEEGKTVPAIVSSGENLPPSSAANELLMDYGQLADAKGTEPHPEHAGPHIGLIGGQSADDESGLDISKYTGPESKASSQIDIPQAPYHSGPDNGLSNQEE